MHSTTKYLNGHSDVVGGAVDRRDAASCTSSSRGGATASASRARRSTAYLTLARPAHAACAHARARRERAARRGAMLARTSGRRACYYPGPADAPRPRARAPAAAGLRRDGQLSSCAGGLAQRAGVPRQRLPVLARRVARRRREPRRASGEHDARRDGRSGARARGHHRRRCCVCRSASRAARATCVRRPRAAHRERCAS